MNHRTQLLAGPLAVVAAAWLIAGGSGAPPAAAALATAMAKSTHSQAPIPRPSDLSAVAATSGRNVWAVGFHFNGPAEQTLIRHWDGRSWRLVPAPSPGGSSNGAISELRLVRPVVLGISFGGWVAIRHASRHPRQAGGLIVAAMTPRLPTAEQIAHRMGALAGAAAEPAGLRFHARPGEQAAAEMQRLCMPLMARRPPSPALAAVRAAPRHTPQVNEHFTPQFQKLDLTGELRAVACTTLAILVDLDPFVTAEVVASTIESLPADGRLITVPDAAHDLFADAPDRLIHEVRRFVVEPQAGIAQPSEARLRLGRCEELTQGV